MRDPGWIAVPEMKSYSESLPIWKMLQSLIPEGPSAGPKAWGTPTRAEGSSELAPMPRGLQEATCQCFRLSKP